MSQDRVFEPDTHARDRCNSSPASIPAHARVVVVGGGVIGTSVAYHLAVMGWKDIVLLERDRLTSGTTWHAAGLMVTFRLKLRNLDRNAQILTRPLRSPRGGNRTGHGVRANRLSSKSHRDQDRLEEYRRISAFNRYCGVDVQELSAREVQELFPLARVDDIEAGFYVKEDGRVNPVDVTMALAKGARMRGVKIIEGVRRPVLCTNAGT